MVCLIEEKASEKKDNFSDVCLRQGRSNNKHEGFSRLSWLLVYFEPKKEGNMFTKAKRPRVNPTKLFSYATNSQA